MRNLLSSTLFLAILCFNNPSWGSSSSQSEFLRPVLVPIQDSTSLFEWTETKRPSFIIYPNPVKDILKIKFLEPSNHDPHIQVFNLLGQKQGTIEVRRMNEVAELDLKALNKGTYIVQFRDIDGSVRTQRITKVD